MTSTRLGDQQIARATHGGDQECGLRVSNHPRLRGQQLRGRHDAVRRRAHVVAGGHQVVADRALGELVARLRRGVAWEASLTKTARTTAS